MYKVSHSLSTTYVLFCAQNLYSVEQLRPGDQEPRQGVINNPGLLKW